MNNIYRFISCLTLMTILNSCNSSIDTIINKALEDSILKKGITVEIENKETLKDKDGFEVLTEVSFKIKYPDTELKDLDLFSIEEISIDNFKYPKNKLLKDNFKIIFTKKNNKNNILTLKLKELNSQIYIPIIDKLIQNKETKLIVYINLNKSGKSIDSIEIGINNNQQLDLNKPYLISLDGENFKLKNSDKDEIIYPFTDLESPMPVQTNIPLEQKQPYVPELKPIPKPPSPPNNKPYPVPG